MTTFNGFLYISRMTEKENKFNFTTVSNLVNEAHKGQVDKGGFPYTDHLSRVMRNVALMINDDLPVDMLCQEDKEHALLLALCHDLLEDTTATKEDLRAIGANELFLKRLDLLSRLGEFKEMSYMDWIRHLVAQKDIVPILVKVGDNRDNNDPIRLAQLPEEQRSISKRYDRAYKILKAALDENVAEFMQSRKPTGGI